MRFVVVQGGERLAACVAVDIAVFVSHDGVAVSTWSCCVSTSVLLLVVVASDFDKSSVDELVGGIDHQ